MNVSHLTAHTSSYIDNSCTYIAHSTAIFLLTECSVRIFLSAHVRFWKRFRSNRWLLKMLGTVSFTGEIIRLTFRVHIFFHVVYIQHWRFITEINEKQLFILVMLCNQGCKELISNDLNSWISQLFLNLFILNLDQIMEDKLCPDLQVIMERESSVQNQHSVTLIKNSR